VDGDDLENAKTYSNPSIPIVKMLIVEITSFIREGQK